jgi:hypothetical protein
MVAAAVATFKVPGIAACRSHQRHRQAFTLSKVGLPAVAGHEQLRLQQTRGGNVEDVERPAAGRRRSPGQLDCTLVQGNRIEIGHVVLPGALSGEIDGDNTVRILLTASWTASDPSSFRYSLMNALVSR